VREDADPEDLLESEDEYLDRASEQKFAPALHDRACATANMGDGELDNDVSFTYWRRAVLQDYTPSLNDLADCFSLGVGCKKDELLAACLERLADSRGYLETLGKEDLEYQPESGDVSEFARILVNPKETEPREREAFKALRACKDQKVARFLRKKAPIYIANRRESASNPLKRYNLSDTDPKRRRTAN
jgi:hypothetical protein